MTRKSTEINDDARRARVDELREILADWMDGREAEELVSDLANFQLALLARKFPATLTPSDKKKVQDNFPGASDSLIAERAMSKEGLAFALALASQVAQIAIDYSPLSHCKPYVDNDEKHQLVIRDVLEPQVAAAFRASLEAGLSPYGATTMLIVLGAINGIKHGVNWAAVARPLVETVSVALRSAGSMELSAEQEEIAVHALMAQMGISRKEAKKYAAHAKRMLSEGK